MTCPCCNPRSACCVIDEFGAESCVTASSTEDCFDKGGYMFLGQDSACTRICDQYPNIKFTISGIEGDPGFEHYSNLNGTWTVSGVPSQYACQNAARCITVGFASEVVISFKISLLYTVLMSGKVTSVILGGWTIGNDCSIGGWNCGEVAYWALGYTEDEFGSPNTPIGECKVAGDSDANQQAPDNIYIDGAFTGCTRQRRWKFDNAKLTVEYV